MRQSSQIIAIIIIIDGSSAYSIFFCCIYILKWLNTIRMPPRARYLILVSFVCIFVVVEERATFIV